MSAASEAHFVSRGDAEYVTPAPKSTPNKKAQTAAEAKAKAEAEAKAAEKAD